MSDKDLIRNSKTESAQFGTDAEVERTKSNLICKRQVKDDPGNVEDNEVLQERPRSLLAYQSILGEYQETLIDIDPNSRLPTKENPNDNDETKPLCLEDIFLEINEELVASTSNDQGFQIHDRQPKAQILEELITFAAEHANFSKKQQDRITQGEYVFNINQDALVHDNDNEELEIQQPAEGQTNLEETQEPVDDDMFGIEVVIPSCPNGAQDMINNDQDALDHDHEDGGPEIQQPAEDQTLLEETQEPLDDDMFGIEVVIPSCPNGAQDMINNDQDSLVHDNENRGLEIQQPAEDQTLLEETKEPLDDDMFGIEVVIPSCPNGAQDMINNDQDSLVHDNDDGDLEIQQPAEDQTLPEETQEPIDDDMFGIEVVIPSCPNGAQDIINNDQDSLVHDNDDGDLEIQQPAEDQTLPEETQEPIDDDMFGIEVVIPSCPNGAQDMINNDQDALDHDHEDGGPEIQQPAEDQTLLEETQEPLDDDMFGIEVVIPSCPNGAQDMINNDQDSLVHDNENRGLEIQQPAEDQTLLEETKEPLDDDMFGIEVVIPSCPNGAQDMINNDQDSLVHDNDDGDLEIQQPAEDQTLPEETQEPIDDDMFGIEVVIPSCPNGAQDIINNDQDSLVHDNDDGDLEIQQPAEDQTLPEETQEPIDDDMFGIEVVIPSCPNGAQDMINNDQDSLVHDNEDGGLEIQQPAEDQTLLEETQEPIDDDMFGIEVVIPSCPNGAQDMINNDQDTLVHDNEDGGLEIQQPADQTLLEETQEPIDDDMFGIEVVIPSCPNGAQDIINNDQDVVVHDNEDGGLEIQQPAEDQTLLEETQEPLDGDMFGIEVVIPRGPDGAQDVINNDQDVLVRDSDDEGLETKQPAEDQTLLEETQGPAFDNTFGIEVVISSCPDGAQFALVNDRENEGLDTQQPAKDQTIVEESQEQYDKVENADDEILRVDELLSCFKEGLDTSEQDAEIETLRQKIKALEEAAKINEGKLFVMRKRTQHRRLGEELRTRFLERKEDLEEELIRANMNLRFQREKETRLVLRDELRQRFVVKFEHKEQEVNDLKKENAVLRAENSSLKNVAKKQEKSYYNHVS